MRDITLEDTFRHPFTTRAFATGVPTVLSGTPVLSVLEENNATPITSGVSVSVDRASVVGLNEATIIATAANGYENGKSYGIYISTGTVGGVSVIGEVVGNFTIGLSAAAVDLANGTDGLTALKTGIDAIPTTAMRGTDNALLAASINLTAGVLDEVATLTGHTAQTGDNFARLGVAGVGLTDLGGMSTGMKAEVNTEVTDVMTVDTFAEVGQEAPAATQSILKMMQYLYKFLRNKKTQTATELKIFADDASTVDHKATVSDDSTTATKGEIGTGP